MFRVYPFPNGEASSELYDIKASYASGGAREEIVKSHICYVSAMPYNTQWPGHQRPLDQREEAAFITAEADEAVTLTIIRGASTSEASVPKEVMVRPRSKGVEATIAPNGAATVTLPTAGYYTVEFDGHHNALHIFIDKPNEYTTEEINSADIIYKEGVHEIGVVELKSGQSVYIDDGAVVYGSFIAKNTSGVRIFGHGILDNSHEERTVGECLHINGCMKFYDCTNISVEGITMRDSCTWCATLFRCDNSLFDGVKAIGMYRYNSDGIDFVNSANGVVRNCFLRNFDDVIVVKGLQWYDERNVENILVENCVLWCDWGRALEIGAETCADEYRNIIFRDCDIIHCDRIMMDIQNGDRAVVHDVLFDDIRCEYTKHQMKPVYQHDMNAPYAPEGPLHMPILFLAQLYCNRWSQDGLLGQNTDIRLNNIQVYTEEGVPGPTIMLEGADKDHTTRNIRITGVSINGQVRTETELDIRTNQFAERPHYSPTPELEIPRKYGVR